MRAKNGSRFEIGRTMELEILVAIVGILAALAIPSLLTALQRSKQKRALNDLTAVATALRNFAGDHNGQYPDPGSFQQALNPTYIRLLPTRDPWGNLYRYECWSRQGGAGY